MLYSPGCVTSADSMPVTAACCSTLGLLKSKTKLSGFWQSIL
jgi:hypothetical protein